MSKTYSPKAKEIKRNWHVIDAKDQILGRLSTKVATLLMGKHRPTFVSHLDSGDYVIVINSKDIKVTGQKLNDKMYYRHSLIPGGFKQETLKQKLAKSSNDVIALSVRGMLPKNKLQEVRLKRLRVFESIEHPYASQVNTQSESKEITKE